MKTIFEQSEGLYVERKDDEENKNDNEMMFLEDLAGFGNITDPAAGLGE